jgi:hypothetical protein
MGGLNLFPARVPIGTVVDSAGNNCDVLMTPEFARALSAVLQRIGGVDGLSTPEILKLAKQALTVAQDSIVNAAFAPPPAPPVETMAVFDDSGVAAQLGVLIGALNDLQVLVMTAPDATARLAEAIKELARRPSTLAQSAIAASVTGTLAATVLATISVPANAMGKNGMLRITTTWSVTNSANNKTIVTRFGATDISSNAVTTVSTYQEQRMIQNRNAANSQVFIFGGFAYTGSPIGTLAKDTTVAQNIDIVAQLSNVGETITLEAYTVELIPSAN